MSLADNLWDRFKGALVGTDATENDGKPALRVVQTNTAGAAQASGDVNNDADVSDIQDVLAVARYNATLPTLTDTRYNALQLSSRGQLLVAPAAGSTAMADGTSNTVSGPGDANQARVYSTALGFDFNNVTWDRRRNNYEETVLASAARTASVDSADLTNYNSLHGIVVTIDVTAASATPSLVFTIQGKSSLGSDYYTILASAAITGTGTTVLRVFPGATAAANLVANDVVPRVWRVSVAAGDADSITYSVSANYC